MAADKDYAETLFEAMDILMKKKIEAIKFDQTIDAVVVDASKAKDGTYLVSTGNAKFTAYSMETAYRENDAVMVTIPQGDYNNQKMIIGKQVDASNTPLIYRSPFQNLVNVSNNLIDGEHEVDFWANNTDALSGRPWNSNLFEFKDSKVYKTSGTEIWSSGDNFFQQGFTSIGIQAQFSTWLSEYGTAFGNYGLAVELTFKCLDLPDGENTFIKIITFDSDEFFGDVYNFETFYTQENVYDISEYIDFPIVKIRLFAYQRNNFKNTAGEYIYGDSADFEVAQIIDTLVRLQAISDAEYQTLIAYNPAWSAYFRDSDSDTTHIFTGNTNNMTVGGDDFSTINPNIFIKDPYICLGIPYDEFSEDTATIMTNSSLAYYKGSLTSTLAEIQQRYSDNEKLIGLRWIHKDPKTNIIKSIEPGELPTGYQIRWYRFKLGAPSPDQFAGAHWSRFYGSRLFPNDQEEWSINSDYDVAYTYENDLPYKVFNASTSTYSAFSEGSDPLVEEHNFFAKVGTEYVPCTVNHIVQTNDVTGEIIRDEYKITYNAVTTTITSNNLTNYYYKTVNDLYVPFAAEDWTNYILTEQYIQYIYYNKYQGFKRASGEYVTLYLPNQYVDSATDQVEITFQPNVNYQTEQIKAIIIKVENANATHPIFRKIAASNILEFTNSDEVRSQATLIDANALGIRFDDDEKGKYFLYNRAGLVGKEEDKERRTLVAVFDEDILNPDKPELTEPYTYIRWEFPEDNTMIIPASSATEDAVPTEQTVFTNTTQVSYYIKPNLNRNATNNTVQLEIEKGGVQYNAQVQMLFGTAGTSGSDYTIVLQWENGENALNLSEQKSIEYGDGLFTSESDSALAGRVYLFDQSGSLVDIQNEEAAYNFSWYKISVPTGGENPVFASALEEKEIYYPVSNNTVQPMIWSDYTKTVDYLVPPLSGATYAQYYPELSQFSTDDVTYSTRGIFYRKLDIDENQKIKITFRAFDFVSTNYAAHPELAGHISYNAENKSTYYYSKDYPAFVKYHDTYIIDPWEEYSEVETYYEPVYTSEKDYSRLESGGNVLTIINDSNTTKGRFIIHGNPSMNSLYILKVDLTSFGDYDLSACFPVPLKNGEKFAAHTTQYMQQHQKIFVVDYIEGATDVRYSTTGETDFNKNPYQITTRVFIDHDFERKRQGYQPDDAFGHWQLLYHADSNTSLKNFLPALIEYNDNNSEHASILLSSRFDKPLLRPPGLYFEDTPLYGVQFVTDVDITLEEGKVDAGTVLWTQPIFSYKDNYPSTTLNKWNGKDIVTDSDTGIITTNGLAAGKKERDNTFTGVVLGDWSRDDADTALTKETGVFGFNHGEMSYALREDGTAFLGKDGRGRIYLSGQKSQIYSQNWILSQEGMLLDIDEGIIKLVNKLAQGFQVPSGDYTITDSTSFQTALAYYTKLYFANPYIPTNQGTPNKWKYVDDRTYIPSDLIKKEGLTASGLNSIYNEPYWYVGVENASTLNSGNDYVAFTPSESEQALLQEHASDNKFTAVDETIYRLKNVRVKIEQRDSKYELAMINAKTGTTGYSNPMLVLVIEKKIIKYKKVTTYGNTGLESSWQRYYLNTKTAYFYYKLTNSNYFYQWYNQSGHNNAIIYCDNDNFSGQVYFFRANRYTQFTGATDTVILNDNSGESGAITFNYLTDALEGFFFTPNSSSYSDLSVGTTHKYDPNITYYYQNNNATIDKYITMSVAEQTYPLSIGNTKSVPSRKFRVNWDGDLYSEDGYFRNGYFIDGDFSGKITSHEGEIGGWIIGPQTLSSKYDDDIYLDGYTGLIHGARIETDSGHIGGLDEGWEIGPLFLRGGDTMLHATEGVYTDNIKIKETNNGESWSYFGGMGYVGAEFVAGGQTEDPGVALYYGTQAMSSDAIYKVNGKNLGFLWYGAYMSLSSETQGDFGSRAGDKVWVFAGKNSTSTGTTKVIAKDFSEISVTTGKLVVNTGSTPAEAAANQEGIYARFA